MSENTGKHKQLLLAGLVAIVLLSSAMLTNFSVYADKGSNNDSNDDHKKTNTLPQTGINSPTGDHDGEHKKGLKGQEDTNDDHKDNCNTSTNGKYNHECDDNGDDHSCKQTTNGKYDHECDKDDENHGNQGENGNNTRRQIHEMICCELFCVS